MTTAAGGPDEQQYGDHLLPENYGDLNENKKLSFTNYKLCYGIALFLFLLGIACFLQLFFVPQSLEDLKNDTIRDRIVMKEKYLGGNREDYKKWISNDCKDCPEIFYSYSVYNISNMEQVLEDGANPDMDEIGPFVYKYITTKTDVEFTEEGDVVEYVLHQDFIYQPEDSIDLDRYTTRIYTLSPAILGAFVVMNYFVPNVNWSTMGPQGGLFECWDENFADFEHATMETLFYNSSAYNFLHGITSEYFESFCMIGEGQTFYHLVTNGTMLIKEKTGLRNISEARELIEYRNFTSPSSQHPLLGGLVDVWEDKEFVDGSRAFGQFPPEGWVTKRGDKHGRPLSLWATEKYRKADYVFDRQITYKGLKLLRFRVDDAVFYNTSDAGGITKYRMYDWPSGLVNLTFFKGTPAYISKGHLYGYDYYQDTVNEEFNVQMLGGGPDQDEDDQYFDVDPISGIAFRNYHTFQINFRAVYPLRPYLTSYTASNISWWDQIIPFARVQIRGAAQDKTIEFYADLLAMIDSGKDGSLYGGPILMVFFFGFAVAVIIKTKRMNAASNVTFEQALLNDGASEVLMSQAMSVGGKTTDNKPLIAGSSDGNTYPGENYHKQNNNASAYGSTAAVAAAAPAPAPAPVGGGTVSIGGSAVLRESSESTSNSNRHQRQKSDIVPVGIILDEDEDNESHQTTSLPIDYVEQLNNDVADDQAKYAD